MDKIQEIKELKKKLYNAKEYIKHRYQKGINCEARVKEFYEIIEKIEALGGQANITSSSLREALDHYKNGGKSKVHSPGPKPQTIERPLVQPAIIEAPVVPEESIYKITLAWTERPGHEPGNTIKIIEDYLTENGAKQIDNTLADFDGYTEVMRSYEWVGGDKEFAILRRSANYILDIFAENRYEKFNISIFGSKKR